MSWAEEAEKRREFLWVSLSLLGGKGLERLQGRAIAPSEGRTGLRIVREWTKLGQEFRCFQKR